MTTEQQKAKGLSFNWHKLEAAQGFPVGYQFAGTKMEVTKQIGNAVPCGLAKALVRAVLGKEGGHE